MRSNTQRIKAILKEYKGNDRAIIDELMAEGLAISVSQAKRYMYLYKETTNERDI